MLQINDYALPRSPSIHTLKPKLSMVVLEDGLVMMAELSYTALVLLYKKT